MWVDDRSLGVHEVNIVHTWKKHVFRMGRWWIDARSLEWREGEAFWKHTKESIQCTSGGAFTTSLLKCIDEHNTPLRNIVQWVDKSLLQNQLNTNWWKWWGRTKRQQPCVSLTTIPTDSNLWDWNHCWDEAGMQNRNYICWFLHECVWAPYKKKLGGLKWTSNERCQLQTCLVLGNL